MNKTFRIIFYSLIVLTVLYGIAYLIWGGANTFKGSSISLILTYILLGMAVAITVIAAIGNIIYHPKSGLKSLIGIGVLILIAIIGYSVSQGEILDKYIDFGVETPGKSKMVDAGLYLMYGTVIIAVVGIIISEFTALFKN